MDIGPWKFAKSGQRIARWDPDGRMVACVEMERELATMAAGDYCVSVMWPGQGYMRQFNSETLQEAMAFADSALEDQGHVLHPGRVYSAV